MWLWWELNRWSGWYLRRLIHQTTGKSSFYHRKFKKFPQISSVSWLEMQICAWKLGEMFFFTATKWQKEERTRKMKRWQSACDTFCSTCCIFDLLITSDQNLALILNQRNNSQNWCRFLSEVIEKSCCCVCVLQAELTELQVYFNQPAHLFWRLRSDLLLNLTVSHW